MTSPPTSVAPSSSLLGRFRVRPALWIALVCAASACADLQVVPLGSNARGAVDDPGEGDDEAPAADEDLGDSEEEPDDSLPEGFADDSAESSPTSAASDPDAGVADADDAGAPEQDGSTDAATADVPWVIRPVPIACFFPPIPLYCFDVSILFDAGPPESH